MILLLKVLQNPIGCSPVVQNTAFCSITEVLNLVFFLKWSTFPLIPLKEEKYRNQIQLTKSWLEKLNKLKSPSGKSYALQFKIDSNPELLPDDFKTLPSTVREQVLYQITYDGYLQRETKAASRLSKAENMFDPAQIFLIMIYLVFAPSVRKSFL
jgi:hypothetical protein